MTFSYVLDTGHNQDTTKKTRREIEKQLTRMMMTVSKSLFVTIYVQWISCCDRGALRIHGISLKAKKEKKSKNNGKVEISVLIDGAIVLANETLCKLWPLSFMGIMRLNS